MKPALGYNKLETLKSWQDIGLGTALKYHQELKIKEIISHFYGHHLLKVGSLASQLDTSGCTIAHQVSLSSKKGDENRVGIIADHDELPISNNSIDTALINHLIEFCPDPHQVLREMHRVILPGGNLVISVFNPFSLLLISRFMPFVNPNPFTRARLFTVGRIKDWLHLLGFEVLNEHYLGYSTLLSRTGDSQPLLDQELGNSFCSQWLYKLTINSGRVCILVAKKREWPLTPIRPRKRFKTGFRPAITGTAMSSKRP